MGQSFYRMLKGYIRGIAMLKQLWPLLTEYGGLNEGDWGECQAVATLLLWSGIGITVTLRAVWWLLVSQTHPAHPSGLIPENKKTPRSHRRSPERP